MKKSRLFSTLLVFSARDLTAFRKFLDSPYFNQRADLKQLFEVLIQQIKLENWEKTEVWKQLYPDQAYDDQGLRLLMSYLQRLVEQFLAVEQLLAEKVRIKREAITALKERDQTALQDALLKEAVLLLEKTPRRDADYLREKHQLQAAKYLIKVQQQPDKNHDLQEVSDAFDLSLVAAKLRESCQLLSHQQVYQSQVNTGLLPAMLAYVEERDLMDIPCIGLYVHVYYTLMEPEDESHFQQFKTRLIEEGHLFQLDEIRDLYVMAINYGIRRVNDGHQGYFHDIMDLYRQGLAQEYLLQNSRLSRFTYNNIVSVALQIGEVDWAEQFLENWTVRLDRRYRERMLSFNQAKLAYHRKDYTDAISLLQRANYHDLLLNLGARTLLLKIYFELDEYDALISHLDAFQSYLRRKSDLGYHRTNYRNLIRYTRKILHLKPGDQKQRQSLQKGLQEEEVLTERQWLLTQLSVNI